jgi:hypothetical protein
VSKHPGNGPTFSKAPPKKRRSKDPPSPVRKQAELEQQARDAERSRRFDKLVNEVGLGRAVLALRKKPSTRS